MTYELFQQGPAVYIPIMLFSLGITVLLYCAFPLIFSRTRKKYITRKKYTSVCFGVNILVFLLFTALNGETAAVGPYFLWTWVFSRSGIKTLENRGILDSGNSDPTDVYRGSVVESAKTVCPNCKKVLPDNSEFCQFCGSRVLSQKPPAVTASFEQAAINSANQSSPLRGNTYVKQNVPHDLQMKHRSKHKSVVVVILVLLVLISIGLNVAQYYYYQSEIAEVKDQLEKTNSSLDDYKRTVALQKNQMADYKDYALYYEAIIKEMRYGNSGYGSNTFYVDDSVIVVHKNETDRTFTLTTNWNGYGSVSVDYSSFAAWVSFAESEWHDSVEMTVHPRFEGVTVVTFSNDNNSSKFKVLIIVTE